MGGPQSHQCMGGPEVLGGPNFVGGTSDPSAYHVPGARAREIEIVRSPIKVPPRLYRDIL